MEKTINQYNKKWLAFAMLSLVIFGTSIYNILEKEQPSDLKINPYFDVQIGNVANARLPTEYDIYVGVADFGEGEYYQLYKSKTIVTNDFGKLFIGGKA